MADHPGAGRAVGRLLVGTPMDGAAIILPPPGDKG